MSAKPNDALRIRVLGVSVNAESSDRPARIKGCVKWLLFERMAPTA